MGGLRTTKRGNYLYEPDGEVLEEYLHDKHELVCVQGPIGSGTSTASCHRIWKLACEQASDYDGVRRTRWLIVRDSYRQLKKTTVKTWLEWFPEIEWGDLQRSEPMTHHLKRKHPSGDGTTVDCEVIFLAIDSPETAEREAASFEITGFWVNEAQFADKEVVDELLSRCGRYPSMKNGPGASWRGGMLDMNAPIEGHWIPYMRGDMPLPPDMSAEERLPYEMPMKEDGTPAWKFMVQPPGLVERRVEGKIVYQPNPGAENQKHLNKSYLEQIRGKTKEWIDRRVMNKVGLYTTGKPVYPGFSDGDHVSVRDLRPVPGIPIIVGLDFGREPAAAFCQNINGSWQVMSELIGSNESAEKFAPRVKAHLAQVYPGFSVEFWGDPRGADGAQSTETTAYDVFNAKGMRVLPATTDNNTEMRRSTMDRVLERRNGLVLDPGCLVLKNGMAGGYHYPKIKGAPGVYRDNPAKNQFSHIVEALENAILGGGEGWEVTRAPSVNRVRPSPVVRRKVRLGR